MKLLALEALTLGHDNPTFKGFYYLWMDQPKVGHLVVLRWRSTDSFEFRTFTIADKPLAWIELLKQAGWKPVPKECGQ